MNEMQRYLHLDFGPCGIDGPTNPVVFEDKFMVAKVEIPEKCSRCTFLVHNSIHGFTCRKDQDKWGGIYRGLDWGAWAPDRIYPQLPYPRSTSKSLVDAAYDEDLTSFVAEHRRINPGLSMTEAQEDYEYFQTLIAERTSGTESSDGS